MDNEDIKFYGNSPENKRSLTSLIKERLQDVKDAISDSFENMDLSNVALAGVFTIGVGLAGGLGYLFYESMDVGPLQHENHIVTGYHTEMSYRTQTMNTVSPTGKVGTATSTTPVTTFYVDLDKKTKIEIPADQFKLFNNGTNVTVDFYKTRGGDDDVKEIHEIETPKIK